MPGPVPSPRFLSGRAEADSLFHLPGDGPAQDRKAANLSPQGLRFDFVTRDPLGLRDLPLSDIVRPGAGTDPVDALQSVLTAELGAAGALVFPSAVDAIRGTLPAFLGPGDDVLVDSCADPVLFETVALTGARLHRYPSASLDGVERRLRRLARNLGAGRLVIVAPAVSARCARVTDVAGLVELARQHGAALVVDVAQDFGVMGQDGRGVMEIQSCLGRVDLVLGCLAGAFGTTGGFVAWGDAGRDAGLRRDRPASASLPADRAGTALAAATLVFGAEGRRRRRRLHGLSLRLRNQLKAAGLRVPGGAVPFVPVLLPLQTALPRTALLESAGPRVGLLMAPKVPLHAPRWRIELSALHGLADIDDLADLIRDVSRAFDRLPARRTVPA